MIGLEDIEESSSEPVTQTEIDEAKTLIDTVETGRLTDPDSVRAAIEKDIADYAEPYPGAREKLTDALAAFARRED